MGWLSKLVGQIGQGEDLENLVRRLTFYLDYTVFQDALREATAYTARGNELGVWALREAIRIRSRQRKVEFFSVNFTELEARSNRDPVDAKDRLMDLALLGRVLYNPSFSQSLLIAILNAAEDGGAERIKQEIFVQAGADQGFDFQLLYYHFCASVQLTHAQKEQSVPGEELYQIPRTVLRSVA